MRSGHNTSFFNLIYWWYGRKTALCLDGGMEKRGFLNSDYSIDLAETRLKRERGMSFQSLHRVSIFKEKSICWEDRRELTFSFFISLSLCLLRPFLPLSICCSCIFTLGSIRTYYNEEELVIVSIYCKHTHYREACVCVCVCGPDALIRPSQHHKINSNPERMNWLLLALVLQLHMASQEFSKLVIVCLVLLLPWSWIQLTDFVHNISFLHFILLSTVYCQISWNSFTAIS